MSFLELKNSFHLEEYLKPFSTISISQFTWDTGLFYMNWLTAYIIMELIKFVNTYWQFSIVQGYLIFLCTKYSSHKKYFLHENMNFFTRTRVYFINIYLYCAVYLTIVRPTKLSAYLLFLYVLCTQFKENMCMKFFKNS